MQSDMEILLRIEGTEARLLTSPRPQADVMVSELETLMEALPGALRERYTWASTWTRHPIARLRSGSCTGCTLSYSDNHPFLHVVEPHVTYCQHCKRILLLRDLILSAVPSQSDSD
jgi:predicted  nucleic acid-binding Zn-ribbon protein